MTLGIRGFKTKKELKAHVGKPIAGHIVETSIFGPEYRETGVSYVVGPCYKTNRKWDARITCEKGVLSKVE